ncbi:hypothetical protein FHR71_001212 [Methylobacterium sp. RAS18]|nr:hypothetical protein [Methylobacterium sp. RAS18]
MTRDAFFQGRDEGISWDDISEVSKADWERAALATPRTDSAERTAGEILTEACKQWELCFGDPPEYGSPLHGVFVAGMIYTERLLASLLSVSDYEHGDGSEDFDADATQSLRNILIGANLWDADENHPVAPAPSSPGVPDSVRALSDVKQGVVALRDQARSNLAFYKEHGSDLALLESQNLAAFEAVLGLFAAHPARQSTGQGADLRKTLTLIRDFAGSSILVRNDALDHIYIVASVALSGGSPGWSTKQFGTETIPDWLVEFVRSSAHKARFHALPHTEYWKTVERASEWAASLQARRAEMLRTASECDDAEPGSGAYRRGVAQGIEEALADHPAVPEAE